MTSVLILLAITATTLLGDYLIKLASAQPQGLANPVFLAGMVVYGLTAVGWFYLMRSHSLAAIGVLYSAMTIVLLAGMGVVLFHEPFGAREALGVGLAVAEVAVMRHG